MNTQCFGASLAAMCLAAAFTTARAQDAPGGFTVAPVRLEMPVTARATSLTFTNASTELRTLQVEAMRWSQEDGQDHYEPATDLVVNPPVFRIAPGASQIIRAGFRTPSGMGATDERAYRLYLQEMPDSEEPAPNQLRLLLRIGVPLFVEPATSTSMAPRWSVVRNAAGAAELQLSNAGTRRLRVDTLAVTGPGGHRHDLAGLSYVLPGATRRWPLPPDAVRAGLRVDALTDAGALDVALDVH